MEKVTDILDYENPVDVVYLDFVYVFDRGPYQMLFKKLRSHGICEQISV